MLERINWELSEMEAEERIQDLHVLLTDKLQKVHHTTKGSEKQHHQQQQAPLLQQRAARAAAEQLRSSSSARCTRRNSLVNKPTMLKCGVLKQCTRR
jgi:hypothetical protein